VAVAVAMAAAVGDRHRRQGEAWSAGGAPPSAYARDVLRLVLVGVGLVGASWALLVVLATRLQPGVLRELAAFLPACVTTVRRLRGDPRVPRSAKLAVAFAGLWVLSPIDLIPEFLPVVGPLDDVVVVALCLRFAARRVPREVITAAWPGDPATIERLLGRAEPARS
jgi:uncharacterized membrane protein YkvA (DUF1232 family)